MVEYVVCDYYSATGGPHIAETLRFAWFPILANPGTRPSRHLLWLQHYWFAHADWDDGHGRIVGSGPKQPKWKGPHIRFRMLRDGEDRASILHRIERRMRWSLWRLRR